MLRLTYLLLNLETHVLWLGIKISISFRLIDLKKTEVKHELWNETKNTWIECTNGTNPSSILD